MLPPATSDLENRRPVWSAMSDLFLDTALTAKDIQRIERALARSPYSLDDLDRILLYEVYPACRSNLFVWPGGEWLQFDPEWLERRALRRRSILMRVWTASVGRLGRFCSFHWRRIKRAVAAERDRARGASA